MIEKIYNFIKIKLTLINHKKKWRSQNKHNQTHAENTFPHDKVTVGKFTYGNLNLRFYGSYNEKIEIGNFCSIAENVRILAGGEHAYTHVSTFPFYSYVLDRSMVEARTKGPIIIEDDVWIGHSVIILSGVTIGQGSIVGAGSVVSKSIPPYSIFVNSQVVKKRFTEEQIIKLIKFDYSNLSKKDIENNIELLNSEDLSSFLKSDFFYNNVKK